MSEACCVECGQGNTRRELTANLLSSEARRTTYEGQEFLVVPVVMARRGVVMNGALLADSEFFPQPWNGTPVTVGHPEIDGMTVSANSPEVLSEWHVGRLFGAEVTGDMLRAEAWIEIGRAERIRPGLVGSLEAGEPMDVSTGYFSRDIPESGESNGRRYNVVSHSIRPDHLALLPDEPGACSWADGCGVRANERGWTMHVNEALKTIVEALGVGRADVPTAEEKLKKNELSHSDLHMSLQRQLDRMDSMLAIHYLVAVFDDDFVYKVCPLEGSGEEKMYRRTYSVDSNESVTMGDDITPVRQVTEYRSVSTGDEEMADNSQKPKKNDENGGTEATENPETGGGGTASQPNGGGGDATGAEGAHGGPVTLDQIRSVVEDTVKATLSAQQAALSKEDQEALAVARQTVQEKRESLIGHITSNSDIPRETLDAMDNPTLQNVAAGIRPVANYAGRFVPGRPAAAEAPDYSDMFQTNVRDDSKSQ